MAEKTVWVGWISWSLHDLEAAALLKRMGITLEEEQKPSPNGNDPCYHCIIPGEVFAKMNPLWGRFLWGLVPRTITSKPIIVSE